MSIHHSAVSVLAILVPPGIEGPASQQHFGPTRLSQMRPSGETRGLGVLTYLHLLLIASRIGRIFFWDRPDRLVKSSMGPLPFPLIRRSAVKPGQETGSECRIGHSPGPLVMVDRTRWNRPIFRLHHTQQEPRTLRYRPQQFRQHGNPRERGPAVRDT